MDAVPHKPKLVYFQRHYDSRVPEFLLSHVRDHVRCLSVFFDVAVIAQDCDYAQICDLHEPDLTLFEAGPNFATCRRLKIRNLRARAHIPRLGLLNCDGWCETRAGVLSEMDHWGVQHLVSIAVTAAEHTPAIADRLFVWPNFVDPEVFRDYGESKPIPMLFSGAQTAQYPWRVRVANALAPRFPTLIWPHPGYYENRSAGATIHGVDYARTINASRFAAACGTIGNEVIRKHFEIPACRTCLVTEASPGLVAAGFEDMVNCVFADERNVLDKIHHLLRHPDELQAIVDAGHKLVHERHTLYQRDQILKWFHAYSTCRSDQRIVQATPFSPPVAAPRAKSAEVLYLATGSRHLALLREGDALLQEGKYESAERAYAECLAYMGRLPEAKLRLAVCILYQGNARRALSLICEPIQYTLAAYRAADPDPVEWAYLVVALLCLGRVRWATRAAAQFPWLRHWVLDTARFAVASLQNPRAAHLHLAAGPTHARDSIHLLPWRTAEEWMKELRAVLETNRQFELVAMLPVRVPPALSFQGRMESHRALVASSAYSVGGLPKTTAEMFFLIRQKAGNLFKKFTRSVHLVWRAGSET